MSTLTNKSETNAGVNATNIATYELGRKLHLHILSGSPSHIQKS